MFQKMFTSIFAFIAICSFSWAQTNVLYNRPQSNVDGAKLSIQQAVYSRQVYPEKFYTNWINSKEFIYLKNKKWYKTNVDGSINEEYTPNNNDYKVLPQVDKYFPCNGYIAYSKNKSVYLIDKNGNTTTIAQSENPNIVYGEIVSRNEFGIEQGMFWSPDGSKLAFYRKDESKVTNFPLLNIKTRTGSLIDIKYPMDGMDSEIVSLAIYDINTNSTVYADVTDFGQDRYLTNITWAPDSKHIFIQVLDRSQKNMNLNMYNALNGKFEKTILQEHNNKFVEPLDPLYFIKESPYFIYKTNNRNAYKNLYLCDTLGTVCRLTCVDADVEYIGNNGKTVFYTSAEISPIENQLFSIDLTLPKKHNINKVKFSTPKRLTHEQGWHNISMNQDCSYYIDNFSSFNNPGNTYVKSGNGKYARLLHTAQDPLKNFANVEVCLGTVKSADGKYDNYYRLYKPLNLDTTKKYPVIVYVYGGPHSQLVKDEWLGSPRMWEYYMAQKGYIVYVQDNRGTLNRGQAFEQAIHKECGQKEMADQMKGVEMLLNLPYVDKNRIGVHGWSYGGFMTITMLTTHPNIFKVGVAGGPVIDWKWYEVMYGERYMETPKTNPEGFAKTSLINKAKDLKGKLLICQGAIDNTVVWENSLSFVQECIQENIQLDYFPYPCSEHNVTGEWRVHLMTKVTDYFDLFL